MKDSLKTRIRNFLISTTGYYIYKRRDLYVGVDFITDLTYKLDISPSIIFDVGANVGQTAYIFHSNLDKKSLIYSFEPIKSTYMELRKNTKNIDNVFTKNIALGSSNFKTNIQVFEGEESVYNSIVKDNMNIKSNSIEEIEVMTGDYFCELNNIAEIDILKIDTEGYELEVLKDFKEKLRQNKIKVLYCEVGFHPKNKRNSYFLTLYKYALENSFKFYGLYEVTPLKKNGTNNYGNVMFVHESFC